MRNVIFLSPNFPTNYWQFCKELKNNGMNVLGIGDQPYDELNPNLKESLNEYYKVGSLENYDEVYRAVAFFIFKHGKIDFLESNNEYWLERDAALRTDGSYDYSHCFSLVKERISRADVAIGNLEVTLGGEPYRGYPQFSAPDEYLHAIHDAGFDILGTANNHSLDRRKRGLGRSVDFGSGVDGLLGGAAAAATASIPAAISSGIEPPLVSHSTSQLAPASFAARSVFMA